MDRTIVIVDDNNGFRARAGAMLAADGYRVVGEAADGGSGLDAVLRLRPDIALLDVQLPDVDGFAVAERLRERGSDAAVVITSTRDAADYGGAIAACGARGFIAKSELSADALGAVLAGAP